MILNQNPDGDYPIVTFGLSGEPLGRRDLVVRSIEPHLLRNALFETWQDQVPHLGSIEVHFVFPQPLVELHLDKTVVLIIEIIDSDTEGDQKPILMLAADDKNILLDEPKARYLMSPTSVQHLRHMFPLSHLCQPHGIRECSFQVAGSTLTHDEPFPFCIGSLCKLTMGGLSEQVTQAQQWMPQYEIFINHCGQHMQGDDSIAQIVLHALHSRRTIPVDSAIVNDPHRLWALVSQSFQSDSWVIHYTPNGLIHLLDSPNVNAFHFVVEEPDTPCPALIVTRCCTEAGIIHNIGFQVLVIDPQQDEIALHAQLTQRYGIEQTQGFQIEYVNPIIDRVTQCQGAQVVIHTVYSLNRVSHDRSRSPRRHSAGPAELFEDDHAASLLQVNHVVLRQGTPPIERLSSAVCEFTQRTQFVQDFPYHFQSPMAWTRVPVPIASLLESHVDVISPIPTEFEPQTVTVVVEVLTPKHDGHPETCLKAVSIPPNCDVNKILKKCRLKNTVLHVTCNGHHWTGTTRTWNNADLVTFFVAEDVPCWSVVSFDQSDVGLSGCQDLHTVFFDDTSWIDVRVDFVGSRHSVEEWCGTLFHLTLVRQGLGRIASNQHVWLASKEANDQKFSILLGVTQPCGLTAWEHKRINRGQLLDCIPQAKRHKYICDGHWAPDAAAIPGHDGEAIMCVVRTCREVCDPSDASYSSASLGEGLAPCPCDRWCAKPNPMAQAEYLQPDKQQSRVTISLDAAIPPWNHGPTTQLPGPKQLHIDFEQCDLNQVLAPLPDGVKLKLSSAKAIWDAHSCAHPQFIELYIDGSSSSQGSGWAVVAVATDWCHNRSFIGCAAGQTEIDPKAHQWVGAISTDNIAAEISALVAAQVAAIISQFPTIIRPDLQFSRHLVQGSQTSTKVGPIVEVTQILADKGARHVFEVRAHNDDPYNELADSLAKWAASTGGSCGSIPFDVPHQIANRKDNQNLWLMQMPECFAMTMPQAEDGILQVVNSNRIVNQSKVDNAQQQMQTGEVSSKVVSLNVQSIREDKKNQKLHRRNAAITSRLDSQWHSCEASIIGLQEARTPEGRFRSKHYEIFSSGADESHDCPHFGCEIWFHCSLPLISFERRRYFSADFKKVVIHKDSRRLIIQCSSDPLTFVVASLHAPCLSQRTTIQQIRQWWNETCLLLKTVAVGTQILCVDANAPLSPTVGSAIGQVGAEPINPQGRIVQEFINNIDLCVPSSFPECHEGSSETWRHPKGAWMRRDYIFVTRNIQSWCQKSYVDTSFDSGKTHFDHLPVVLEVKGFLQGSDHARFPKIDTSKASDPNFRMAFQQALNTLPLPSWDVDLDSHSKIWEQNVLQIAQQIFKPDLSIKKRHRPQLTDDTLHAIAFKRHILQVMRFSSIEQHDEYQRELREVEKIVRQKVARDQACWYENFLKHLQESGDIHDSKAVFAKLHRLGGGKCAAKVRPLPMMKDQNGQVAQSFEQSQQILFQHFAQIEGGQLTSQEELEKIHSQYAIISPDDYDADLVPTLSQIRQVISGMKKGKVPGPNRITTDVLKAGGVEIAKQMVPLLMKCTLHCSEPLSWKGGNLIALFKGKGSHADPKSYRSIFLSDTTAKVYHANLRNKLDQAWIRAMDVLQFGGRKGCSPDFAHHILHSFLAWSKVKKKPAAAIFVDLQSAFYSVLRQGLFQGEINDTHVCNAMVQLGVSPEEFQEITSTVSQEAATAGISSHSDQLFRNLFSATHFRMTAIGQPCHTSKGTRPGDPIADVLFNMSMVLILRSTRNQIEATANISNVAVNVVADTIAVSQELPPQGYLDVAFVDDCVFMTFAHTNDQMLRQAKNIQSVFHDEARKRGLKVNYEKGKTEIIMQCHGHNTRAFRRTLLIDSKASIPIVCENETHLLRIVHGYKHLGSYVQEGASVEWDRRQKVAQARQAWWSLRKSFFNKRAISSHVKTTILNALIKSRAIYNVHVWSWITPKDVEHWNDTMREMISPIVKSSLHGTPAFQYTSAQLCALAGILDLQEQLHVNRLMYLHRMLTWAPPILWTFLMDVHAPQGWWHQLRISLQCFETHYPGKTPFTTADDTVTIVQKIALDRQWRSKVKKASKSAVAYHKRQADGLVWSKSTRDKLQTLGCATGGQASNEEKSWHCELCQASFHSKRGLAMHSHLMHGYVREAKHYILDDSCHACGKSFHTRARAIAHVEMNPKCLTCYRSCMVPVDEETLQKVEEVDKACRREMQQQGWNPTKALKPVIKLVGPTLPPSGTHDAYEMKMKWAERVESTTRAACLQGFSTGQDVAQEVKSEGPPFILDSPGGRGQGHAGCAHNRGPPFLTAQINSKAFFFLHFFSGFRREKDLHWQIQNKWVGEGWQVYCISIDLCLCRQHSDLTSKESYDWWLQKARDGYVIGAGGGPPCETYSSARYLPGGPPPVRSADDEWGLPGLSKKQHMQVEVGSKLVQFLVSFLVALIPLGLCGFIEHPAFPCWAWTKHPASIWANATIRQLAKLCCFTMTTFDQCTLGAKVKKPTGLLLLRLSAVRDHIRLHGDQGRCNHPAGSHPRLQGTDEQGKFKTSWAKVYPEGLNSVLAEGICNFAAELRTGSVLGNLEGYPSFFRQFQTEEFVERHVVQKDYHETTLRWLLRQVYQHRVVALDGSCFVSPSHCKTKHICAVAAKCQKMYLLSNMAILGSHLSFRGGGGVCYLMGLSHCQDVARPG